MDKISVIVPVYKVEAYLDRCVRSILDQTYTDFELILVDDGSPDQCGAMCDDWAKKDSRIRVIHKENGGLSDARNAGIDAATGDWLTFIDSDDYVHPDMLRVLLEAARNLRCSVSICTYQRTDGAGLVVDNLPEPEIWMPEDYYVSSYINATIACAKLYSRSSFHDLRYPVGKVHEDEFLTYRILFSQPQLAVVNAPLYGYFRNDQGITRGAWTPGRMDTFEAYTQQIRYFTRNGYIRAAEQQCRWYAGNIGWYIELIERDMPSEARRKYIPQCRMHMRKVLREYKGMMKFSVTSHPQYYKTAYPWASLFISLWTYMYRGARAVRRLVRKKEGM